MLHRCGEPGGMKYIRYAVSQIENAYEFAREVPQTDVGFALNTMGGAMTYMLVTAETGDRNAFDHYEAVFESQFAQLDSFGYVPHAGTAREEMLDHRTD